MPGESIIHQGSKKSDPQQLKKYQKVATARNGVQETRLRTSLRKKRSLKKGKAQQTNQGRCKESRQTRRNVRATADDLVEI